MKNLVLACVVALATLLLGLLALRKLAPRLAGVPVEVRYVQASEEVPPFYKNAFERAGTNETLPDPVTVVREAGLQLRRPGLGPTDLLGFRNLGVPNTADVVVIGDSQTYGHGVEFEDSWPRQLEGRLAGATVYGMACGGWGPAQYLAMARLAGRLRPRVVVVAYYTGNDPHDAFAEAYNKHRWRSLRVSTTLDKHDQPPAVWPVPEGDRWEAVFRDGTRAGFTPGYRLANNDRSHPGVREGFAIIAKTAGLIAGALRGSGARPVFTVIPTKELAYAPRVQAEALRAPKDYRRLVADERANIDELAASLRQVPGALYVDLVEPLQRAVLGPEPPYPADVNGHPTGAGYRAIADALAGALATLDVGRPRRVAGPESGYRPAEPPPPRLSR